MEKKNRHITRKVLAGIGITLLLLIGIALLLQYNHYRKDPSPYRTFLIPRLELSVMEMTMLSADRTDLHARMLIHNPLPFNLRADSMQYRLFISDVEVVKSSYAKSVNIKGWDSTWIDMPVTAYTEKLVNVLKKAENEGRDSLIYGVKTSFATKVLFKKNWDIDFDKELPTVYIPTLKMDKIVWDSLNFEGITLYLNATVINKNKFPLTVKDLKFQFALADHPWVKGTKTGVIDIPDSSVTAIELPLRISFKQIGKSIGPLIKNGKNTPYKYEADLKLVSDMNAIRNSKVILKGDGAIKEITKLMKEQKQKEKEKKALAKAQGRELPEKKKDKVKFEKKKD